MDTLSSAPAAVKLRGPTRAEAEMVAKLIGHPPVNAPKPRRSRYEDIDLHGRKAAIWPDGPLPKMTGEEAVRAAKRLWRKAVGLPWPGTWKAGRGNHRTYPRGTTFLVNPGQGWDGMVHDLSHQAYKYLTTPRPREIHLGWWMGRDKGWSRSRTIGTREGMQPICSNAKIADFEHVKARDSGGRRIHHSDAHAALEREMIRTVVENGWLNGDLRPDAKPKARKRHWERPIRFTLD